ncbi:2-cys peroxiredoxin [Theileria orientalis strain Shintoku]|uniref:2-cys peroxiredoxin n=1 Tax=Theileria orientalis strain Shintoku TaxID=869250 RepID=J7MGR9_THEOR|nr:2-cys peroxiredoxin [Theileria orientalis strain Shintoku]PVC54278.1 2-cys peroxiredoxin [Theileria orientalis]BAM38696.1 2-cys peroxiredoxin [Theileria orientalis strain Shintoku]|eukprot:XP_009688997.1 2-cys peroxiredoxin [Theileria orientalis strain Shintoku]
MIAKLTSLSLMASYIRNPGLTRTVLSRTYSTSNPNPPLGPCSIHTGVQSLLGKPMPFFKGTALDKTELVDLNSKDYFNNSYGLLVFYPLDFTFVCPSELLGFSERLEEFQKRNVKVLGVSVDSPFSHLAWKQMDVKNGGISSLKFPLFSDLNRAVTSSFGLLRDEGFAHRASVLVDKSGVVKHVALYDLGLGRSVDEVLRLFDAVQFSEKTGHVCPVNWKSGDKAMEPNFESTKDYLKERFDK